MLDPTKLPAFSPCGETRIENEPRVHELIARVRALISTEEQRGNDADAALIGELEEIEYGLGGLLPAITFVVTPGGMRRVA